jgi:hypothetical protein
MPVRGYDMDAAAMSLELHGCGIHAVTTPRGRVPQWVKGFLRLPRPIALAVDL